MLLFYRNGNINFSPMYDNGASLGWRFTDEKLTSMMNNQSMNKYTKNTKVKAGIFEKKSVKGKDLLLYIKQNFPTEFEDSIKRIITFDNDRYSLCIHSQNYLSKPQKEWLLHIIPYRKDKMLDWIREEEE